MTWKRAHSSFIHSFNRHQLSTYPMPGSILDSGDRTGSSTGEIRQAPCCSETYVLFRGTVDKKKCKNTQTGKVRWRQQRKWHGWCLQCRRPGFNPWVRKMPWRREWQPIPIFLPRISHGQRSLMGSSQRVRHDWATNAQGREGTAVAWVVQEGLWEEVTQRNNDQEAASRRR